MLLAMVRSGGVRGNRLCLRVDMLAYGLNSLMLRRISGFLLELWIEIRVETVALDVDGC
jgi:hypothetical protein